MIINVTDFHEDAHPVHHVYVRDYSELIAYEDYCLEIGFEGVMMRSPYAPYKQGRGTFKEGIIYKLKRFQDAEAMIVGFKELMINKNTLEKDELGYAKRSSAKDGLVPGNTLGAFLVHFENQILEIAPGNFNHEDRKLIWDNRPDFDNKILKFRFFNHGIKDKPRFPRATGFRDLGDM
jgi:DNA ligase-1